MKLIRFQIVSTQGIKKVFTLFNFSLKIAGNQTFFHRFWPIIQVVSPIFLGYLVFGNLLEQPTDGAPYRIWVCTGVIVWLFFLAIFTVGSRLFSSKTRRKRFLVFGPSLWSHVGSYFIVYFSLATLFSLPVMHYIFKNQSVTMTLLKLLFLLLLFLIALPMLLTAAVLVGICSALFKDFRMLVPFISQVLLFTSPIFFAPPKNNSILEEVIARINPLTPALSSFREFIFSSTFTLGWFFLFYVCTAAICILINSVFLEKFTLKILRNLTGKSHPNMENDG